MPFFMNELFRSLLVSTKTPPTDRPSGGAMLYSVTFKRSKSDQSSNLPLSSTKVALSFSASCLSEALVFT